MLLIQIRDYILKQQEVTLTELATHFQMQESAIEKMADLWLRKKVIEKFQQSCERDQSASSCSGCSSICALKDITETPEKVLIMYRIISQ